jgi:hypothetical protein
MKERVAVGIVTGLLVVLFVGVLVVPVVLRGESPSPLEFLVGAGEILALGFILRTRSSERIRTIGFALLVLGVLGVLGSLALIWFAMQARGV